MKTELCPVKITDEERIKFGEQITHLLQLIDKNKDESKIVAQTYKQTDARLNAERRSLTNILSSGVEYREVELYEKPDLVRMIAEIYRKDTDEFVSSRPLKQSEVQGALPMEDESPDTEESESINATDNYTFVLPDLILELLAGKIWDETARMVVPVTINEEYFNGKVAVVHATTSLGRPHLISAYKLSETSPENVAGEGLLGEYHGLEVKYREPHKKAVAYYLVGPEVYFVPAAEENPSIDNPFVDDDEE